MKTGIVVSLLALALAGGCSKKKTGGEDNKQPTGSGSAATPEPAGSGSSAAAGSGSAATPEEPKPDPKLVARGEYLANILGCPSCHVAGGPQGPDMTKPFAGGFEIKEAMGSWRAPNITPHKGSGVGAWTDAQLMAAIREGVRPDGSQMIVLMPYPNYNRMTDDDAKSLVAYLRTIPAIDNVVAPNKDLPLPKVPMPKPANVPDVTDDPAKHGEYLVTLMHCSMCHTPMGKDGPDMARIYGGGMEFEMPFMGTGKLYGANISSDLETGIGKWTEEQIVTALKTLKRPDGTVIQGPMQFYLGGWSKLEDKDLTSIATYVKSIKPVKNKVPKSTFKPNQGPPPGAAGGSAAPAAGSAAK